MGEGFCLILAWLLTEAGKKRILFYFLKIVFYYSLKLGSCGYPLGFLPTT